MLLSLKSYKTEDLEIARGQSPAIARYIDLLERVPNESLHYARHKAWTECALATVLQTAPARDVCLQWSHVADQLIKSAWEDSAVENMAVMALGKLGAQELNLSSDIDLTIVTSDHPSESQFSAARKFILTLSEKGPFGFCFRVDMDLRPGGTFSPLICSIKQFQDYYWSLGENWERLALVRLRPICGDTTTALETIEIARKYAFRKHLDYGLLQDFKNLRSQIHHRLGSDENTLNLKLAPGGIRDIELFIHALQVIHGGKLSELQTVSTTAAVNLLKKYKLFRAEDLDFLIQTYWDFRTLENKVQAVSDEHTHEIARDMAKDVESSFRSVDQIVAEILGRPTEGSDLPTTVEDQKLFLEQLGYNEQTINESWLKLISLTALSTRTYEDEQVRRKFLRYFCEHSARNSIDPNLALSLLTDFVRNTRAKTSFFYLLHQNPKLINELSLLFGCSPYLGGILASRPELLDSYLLRTSNNTAVDIEQFLENLLERRLMSDLIAATSFLKDFDVDSLSAALTKTADEVSTELLSRLQSSNGSESLDILALGKWGSLELGIQSDLDFIFLLENAPTAENHNTAKRFLTRLSEPHRGGSIYKIDLRLRPSGKAGPLMISKAALINYLMTSASPWERQAYLRARMIYGQSDFENEIRTACSSRTITVNDLDELAKIQKDIWHMDPAKLDIKNSCGGILDIELSAQTAALFHKLIPISPRTVDLLTILSSLDQRWARIAEILRDLRVMEQSLHLVQEHGGSKLLDDSTTVARISRLMRSEPTEVFRRVKSALDESALLLKDLDPRRQYF